MLNRLTNNKLLRSGEIFDENYFEKSTKYLYLLYNASEVIRAGLRLLEENEHRLYHLKNAIQEGLESGIMENFDPEEHLKYLKSTKTK